MTSRLLRWTAGYVSVVTAVIALAWALAQPAMPVSVTTVRAGADIAAVVALGLSVLPLLDEPRHRATLAARARSPLIVAGGLWLVAELAQLVVLAAQASGTAAGLTVSTTARFAVETAPGRSALCGVAAAAALVGAATARPGAVRDRCTMSAAAAGVAARALTGHLSGSALAGAAVVCHALAAALWCGTLAALALTVRSRGQWARVLPVFSRWALWCVGVLLAGGVIAGVAILDNPAQLYQAGYGRVLLAKVVVTVALVVLARRHRMGWLEAARRHRIDADSSLRRSTVELSLMAVALTLAAALAVTG